MFYDDWKLQTPPENLNSDYSICKCKACLENFDVKKLQYLNMCYSDLTERSLVCSECIERISEIVNPDKNL